MRLDVPIPGLDFRLRIVAICPGELAILRTQGQVSSDRYGKWRVPSRRSAP